MNITISQLRTVLLVVFAMAAGASVWALLAEAPIFFWLVSLTHIALFGFVWTEAFGPVARSRSTINRVLARVFLIPSGIVVGGFIAAALRVALP